MNWYFIFSFWERNNCYPKWEESYTNSLETSTSYFTRKNNFPKVLFIEKKSVPFPYGAQLLWYKPNIQALKFAVKKATSNDSDVFSREEAVWHLFLWAILANQKEVVELFIYESSCKIGNYVRSRKIK